MCPQCVLPVTLCAGSYAALDGNNPAVGLAMLTGQPVLTFGSKDRGVTWIKKDVVFNQNKIGAWRRRRI